MLYFINALMFAYIASFWSKEGWANIFIVLLFVTLACFNLIGATPFVNRMMVF